MPATITRLPDWPALRAACAAERWQAAYGAAGLCPGKDGPGLAAWQAAADYIEAEKAAALAALTARWRERRDARAD